MTENQRTRQLLAAIRQRYPHATCYKHNDQMTSGVPDASVTMSGRTLWIEAKRGRLKLTAIQRRTLAKLDKGSDGRAVAVVFEPTGWPHFAHIIQGGTGAPTCVETLDGLIDELVIRLEMGA